MRRVHRIAIKKGGPVYTLMDTPSGTYLVTTESATYLVDLDEGLIFRFPDAHDHEVADLRFDKQALRLMGIHDCTVGREFTMFVSLGLPGVPWTLRWSTPVRSITPAALDGLAWDLI
jgi:hypothetical protein